ncbi:hypothetical protein QBC36DRAFT_189127 [Triangularia setosa]|uniref:FAD-binding PCMH-type domain-containing protein n=1 Tax=Triangularia setosa TaxID=2587417 RepID=A0AAN6W6A8_9PEZI|nr:hypothetical protein QBC36DRAFT_189127 [Podospora setosa]
MGLEQVTKALRNSLPSSNLYFEGEREYETLNGSYLSAMESDIRPAVIFRPESRKQVAKFVKVMKPFALGEHGEEATVQFAIRSGGQQPLPGVANIQGGITLDLGLLNSVELQKDGKQTTVSVGAGARWGAVYDRLEGTGLGVTGVRSASGGVGGLSLTGGVSFFSSREGFVCDNVLNYEVVLASGEIVNANEHENSDLWISLRGGGNNFGVVTRFDFRTFPQPGRFWGGSVFYFLSSWPYHVGALLSELRKKDAADPNAHVQLSIGYSSQFAQFACQSQLFYTGADANENMPDVIRPWADMHPQIEQLNSVRLMTLKEAVAEQPADAKGSVRYVIVSTNLPKYQKTNSPIRCAYMNVTVKADAPTLFEATEIFTSSLENVKSAPGLMSSLTFQPYSVNTLQQTARHGGNSLGLDPSDGPLINIMVSTYWQNKSDDAAILKYMNNATAYMRREAQRRNKLVPFVSMNHAWAHQDVIECYGEENKRALQETSMKFDPEGLFQRGVPGGFKLFN